MKRFAILFVVALAGGLALWGVGQWRRAARPPGAAPGPPQSRKAPARPGSARRRPRRGRDLAPPRAKRAAPGKARGIARAAAAPEDVSAGGRGAIPDEYVLRFYSRAEREAFAEMAGRYGVEVLGRLSHGHALRVRAPDAGQWAALLREAPSAVEWAPNHYAHLPPAQVGEPRDPQPGYLGFGGGALAWLGAGGDVSGWGQGVTVAVLDTGIGAHGALAETDLERVDLLPGQGPLSPEVPAHGTAVASLIAGRGPEAAGLAPGASLLGVRVMPDDAPGDVFTLAAGILEAVERGAQVVNVCVVTAADNPVLRGAVEYAVSRGVCIVAAVGNDGVANVSYPARYAGVLGVGGVDAAGRHLYFSNRGAAVDLAAPGLGVHAAGGGVEAPLVALTGTSASAPLVAGAVAALLWREPALSALEAAEVLAACADDAGAPGVDEEVGRGVLNMARVLERGRAGVYDVAVGYPHLNTNADGDAVGVVIYAQNRGTEPLASIELHAGLDSAPHRLVFYDVPVGATVSHEFALNPYAPAGGVRVTYRAAAPGVVDIRPHNNAGDAVVLTQER